METTITGTAAAGAVNTNVATALPRQAPTETKNAGARGSTDTQSAQAKGKDVSADEAKKIVEEMNDFAASLDNHVSFAVQQDLGRMYVKVINNQNGEVIREIPTKEMRELAARLKETLGVFLDEKS